MKNLLIVGAAALLAGGCCSKSTPKPTLERAWIGGEFRKASRGLVPKTERTRVFVQQVYAGTPAESAGLKPGDLVLAIDDRAVTDIKQFRQLVDASKPGERATIRVLRAGEKLDFPITIGRETYQQWHALTFGLGLSTALDLWPDPDFALMPLGQFKASQERVELRSPEVLLAKQAGKEHSQGETGAYSHEGWNAWLLILGLNSHKRILTQEPVPQVTALQRAK